jgi:hypothetical protein
MRTPALLLCAALAAASCASPEAREGARPEAAKADAKAAPGKRGPTLTLDEQAKLADPTALQLLEERSRDLAKARKRVEELESELRQRGHELDRVRDESRAQAAQKEQLEGLLREATENERTAAEKALSAEIARLRFEQEMLKLKLGNVLREDP